MSNFNHAARHVKINPGHRIPLPCLPSAARPHADRKPGYFLFAMTTVFLIIAVLPATLWNGYPMQPQRWALTAVAVLLCCAAAAVSCRPSLDEIRSTVESLGPPDAPDTAAAVRKLQDWGPRRKHYR